ncbi:hypothetical protein [Oceanobacillus halophilus]|uniref:GIY-YIG nuclease family protein n=1 Tax=Oceanobacillus halophilus TaxID=930130 RepID=A0A494ZXH8_9BACI|nr:hypothetical protein [Oceanobacillus halophilus]RKQ30764.1 hypothetical protein D8M06_15210 [Oceanobacillus halophilus]
MDYIEATITNSQLHTNEDWIYIIVDRNKRKIIHIGSSWLHPVAQMEKHISDGILASTDNLLKLYGFPLPEFVDSRLLKKILVSEFESTEVGDEFNELKLDSDRWSKIRDFSDKLIKQINRILIEQG